MADDAGARRTVRTALLTAAVALPAGWWLAEATRGEPAADRRATPPAATAARDVYSAGFRDDPYVLAQQREVVEALERECRTTGVRCAEARAARRYLEEQGR